MNKMYIYFLLLFLTLQEAKSQKVPRPGGGGDHSDLIGEKETKSNVKSFFSTFKYQLKSCDPKRKMEMNFENVYNYLFHRHMETWMKDSHLSKKTGDYCHKESGEIIDCIMNEKMKASLKILIESKYVENYFKKEKDLPMREIREKIDFLNHLLEK